MLYEFRTELSGAVSMYEDSRADSSPQTSVFHDC